jgi:ligand-binding sensor domain-containing protein/serine phosphatase RsbU (regulator of sigma subunit)
LYTPDLMKVNRALTFLFLLLLLSEAFSQKQWSHLKFRRYGVDQGLTVTTAFSIVQDAHGFLWISTIDGLLRYDGYKFFHYKNDFNDSASISDNTVSTLLAGKGNKLWAGTYAGGLNCLDIANGKFKRFQRIPSNPNSISNNRVWALLEDGNCIWVGTENGLNRIDLLNGKITRYFHDAKDPRSLCHNTILSLIKDKSGCLWVGTVRGLCKALPDKDGNIKEFTTYINTLSNPSSLSGNIVMTLFQSKDRSLWIGTNDGLCKYVPEKNIFEVTRFAPRSDTAASQVYSYLNSYGANAVRGLYEDKYNNLWISTDKGLKILNPKNGEYISYYSDPSNPTTLSADLLYGIYEDRNNNLWIGTIIGGLNKVDLKPEKFSLCQVQNGNPCNLSKNNIRSVCKDSKGTLWIGTLEGGVNRMDAGTEKFVPMKGKIPEGENIWSIFEDRQRLMWFGSSNGLYRYDRKNNECRRFSYCANANSICNNIVRSIFEDSTGNLWVGTEDGLNHLDKSKEKWSAFVHSEKDKNSLSHNTVWTIRQAGGALWVGTDNGLNKLAYNPVKKVYEFKHYFPEKENKNSLSNRSVRSIWVDSDSLLWIGTSNGLNKFNVHTEKFSRYNEENGLSNSYIYGVLGDNSGNLWISSNEGISRFNKVTGHFQNYDKIDGLQNNEFNTGAYFAASNGEMFFGGPDGLNRFFPDSLSENPVPPPIVINSIKVFGVELENEKQPFEIKSIELKHDQNVISFEFAALDFTLPEKNYYSYMLEGFDKGWVKSGTRRFVNYTNLDPGKYRFKVRACNSDGKWNNQGISIELTIVPPFWKTWWFRILLFAAMALSAYGFYMQRVRRFRKVQLLLEEQVSLKTRELREEKETVEQQNRLIEKKNSDITSSIQYAKRIQESILPVKEKLNEVVSDSFIFYKPKDIVSGDFYWFTRQENLLLLATADCTGHGVPGAFMSLIGNNLLNEAVKGKKLTDPAEILLSVHEGLVAALKQDDDSADSVDGMDIALCVYDNAAKQLYFSSTDRPLNLIRNGELVTFRQGEYPLGYVTKRPLRFEKETIQLEKNDVFYIYTDGYCDQFGGKKNEKYLEGNFEKLLLKIHHLPMERQEKLITEEIENWKGNQPQIDDMLVIGIRV